MPKTTKLVEKEKNFFNEDAAQALEKVENILTEEPSFLNERPVDEKHQNYFDEISTEIGKYLDRDTSHFHISTIKMEKAIQEKLEKELAKYNNPYGNDYTLSLYARTKDGDHLKEFVRKYPPIISVLWTDGKFIDRIIIDTPGTNNEIVAKREDSTYSFLFFSSSQPTGTTMYAAVDLKKLVDSRSLEMLP